jgi:hypothetical protein
LARPWRGPARPFIEAANERYGSARAEPTKWQAWALTFPPSWSLQTLGKEVIRVKDNIESDEFPELFIVKSKHLGEVGSIIEGGVSIRNGLILKPIKSFE